MSAPKPANFRALVEAWNSPIAFEAQIATYYAQLEREGYRLPTPDITSAAQVPNDKETR